MKAEEAKRAIDITFAISEAIRTAGQIPSGHLYALVMNAVSIQAYDSIIKMLVGARLVRQDSTHLLTWIGPVLS